MSKVVLKEFDPYIEMGPEAPWRDVPADVDPAAFAEAEAMEDGDWLMQIGAESWGVARYGDQWFLWSTYPSVDGEPRPGPPFQIDVFTLADAKEGQPA